MLRGRLVMVCGVLLAACAGQPDADAIRSAIHGMAESATARRGSDVLERVTDDFTGNDGEFDRQQLATLLRAQLVARSLGVRLGTIEVEMSGDRATARFDAVVTDASGRWISDRRADLHFVTGWRRAGGEWHCYNAQWSGDAR